MNEQVSKESMKSDKINEKKWTKELMDAGFTVIPNIIIERQLVLGLDALDINILMHICTYWWTPENKPHPAKRTIAEAMGITPRTVQRRIKKLQDVGFVLREERRVDKGASKTNNYHLDGLIKAAAPYALEKIQERKKIADERKATAGRKGKARVDVVTSEE